MTWIFSDTIAVIIGDGIFGIIENFINALNGLHYFKDVEQIQDLFDTTDLQAFLNKLPPMNFNL